MTGRPAPVPLTLQAFDQTGTDARGQAVGTWRSLGTVWATVRQLSGRQLEAARSVWAQTTHEILVRPYLPEVVKLNRRFWFRGRAWPIGWYSNRDEQNRELVIYSTPELEDAN